MLLAMVAFFGVIICVNLVLAVVANTSWTGLVVENSYVASQEYNDKLAATRAQQALGWHGSLTLTRNEVRYEVTDRHSHAVTLRAVSVAFRRPVDDREDHTVELQPASQGAFAARHVLTDGAWIVEVNADAGLAHPFRETHRILASDGTAR
jgi:nitrogen fixation protein FixH